MDDRQIGFGASSSSSATPYRPGTPESEAITPAPRGNPFATPYGSVPVSATGSSTALQTNRQRYFHSRRVVKGEVEKPWLDRKDPKEKWVTIIPCIGILIGVALTGFLIWDGLSSVTNHSYCSVFEDDFSNGFDSSIWTKEAEVGGFGNGQFEETTTTDENAFVQDGMLHLKPTLQDASLIDSNNVINLLADGSCSSDIWSNCVTSTNTTNGTIVNPVKSARISTKKSGKQIKYGRIEVEAKLPSGDWLWPAIWMLPVDNVYGEWPRSGEIDIMESRGNNFTYPQGGNNVMSSTLHWGPNSATDGWWSNNNKHKALHTTYSKGFHTFGVEWSDKYVFTYVDTRLLQVMYVNFDKPFWDKGNFPVSDSNGTALSNPWAGDGDAAPFDQDFYLILNVAVGGTNGWFEDGVAGKPWVDGSTTARKEFWDARDQWYPTWEKSGEMVVKSVKMWQQKGYNGCS